MNTVLISELVGSSRYDAIADDAVKDEDNAAWVMELAPAERQAWIERIGWIRFVDRLAEQDLLDSEQSAFQQFQADWQHLMRTGQLPASSSQGELLGAIRDQWFVQPQAAIAERSIQSWHRYIQALERYHQENLVIETLADFEVMLDELAASFFQILPSVSEQHWHVVGQFGVIDQFYNILRDLREDAEQGICYLPTELLDCFGITRAEILQLRAHEHPNYIAMMRFWMYDYLRDLYRKAYPFILAPDLPPSWQTLRDWSLNRYRRIERIMRRYDYNYVRFPQGYWREVKRDLNLRLPAKGGNATEFVAKVPAIARLPWTGKLVQLIEQQPEFASHYRCG